MFQNARVVIHVVRRSRGAGVVAEVTGGHRTAIGVSDLFGARQGHADLWQVCLAQQLRDCHFAIDAGDAVFAPRMKAPLLRAVLPARRRHALAASTRQQHRRRLDRGLRPTAIYRKVTGGFRSERGADPFASVRSVVGTAARSGVDAHAAILDTPCRRQNPAPG